ncbi:hypothetical protein Vretimale_7641 [Volvox reticuliferus]|uniref:Uncharacterized protein n=1 Tax=Volvox reticuliferus TaxID=1737510 RepID=A0A8J4G9Q2_9CHLO|nr:hypothetical protein Vretifemale_7704 [Volvox reticuliferus]GIM02796.1 hypothetical protein Vretimale_7641 [Volvox reticuliferus]
MLGLEHGETGISEELSEAAQVVQTEWFCNEVVERCTKKGTEIVNVDGFKFIRKRKRTLNVEQATAQLGSPAVSGPDSACAQAVPAPDGGAPVAADGLPHIDGNPKSGNQAVDQLAGAEVNRRSPQQNNEPEQSSDPISPKAVVETQPPVEEQREQQHERQQLEQHQQFREQDLHTIVGNLLKFIPSGCPPASSVTWLLRETLRIAVPPDDEDGLAAAAAMLQDFQEGLDQQVAAAQQLLLKGSPADLQQFDSLPPMVRSMCAAERHMASLRQQLAALEREEAEWIALEEKYRSGGGCIYRAEDETLALSSGDSREESTEVHVDLEVLKAVQQRAELQLSLQVEAINDMLDKAELMVTRAQQTCASLQADYHKENFQSYAHVNSPNVLVKILSQALPTAGEEFVPASQPTDD